MLLILLMLVKFFKLNLYLGLKIKLLFIRETFAVNIWCIIFPLTANMGGRNITLPTSPREPLL